MNFPEAGTPTTPNITPEIHLTPLLQATVTPSAVGASHNHITGLVTGPTASYSALEAWCSYGSGNTRNLNIGHRRRTRSHHGAEDGAKQRRE